MPPLTATQLGDLTAMTIRNLGKPNITEITTDLQKFTAVRQLLKKNRVDIQSGYGVQWDVMVNDAGGARNNGLADSDQISIVDTTVQAQADWRNTTASWGVIGQELSMNREPARIVDLVRIRRLGCMISLTKLMELNFWGPPVAITDTLTPWGVNTWIVKNATTGFNGSVPSGYTTIGLNPTTYPRWKNYTVAYTAVSRDDFIRQVRKAARFTDFEPPVDGIPTFNTGDNYGFYTTNAVLQPLEESLDSQNDNLGPDLAKYQNKVTFLRTPVDWIPQLEADTTGPFYGINWGWYKTIVLSGWWMKETNIPVYPGQHTLEGHFLDSTYQFVTRNRRCHFIASTGTTYPS